MPRYDLHCHSTHSDGLLPPSAVVARAAERGVDVLALTDHDEVSGVKEAMEAAVRARIALVPGTEVSVSWEGTTIHVVGLGVDPASPVLTEGLRTIREGRHRRARRMADALAEAGIHGAYEGALGFVTSAHLVSRTHFARFLVAAGHAREVRDVFSRFLVRGKPGYVPHTWASLADGVRWITASGGRAVLAHPGRYRLGRGALSRLLAEFRDAGGEAIEVISSSHTPAQGVEFAAHARRFGLLASVGSDYHGPGESWMDLGAVPDLPSGVVPVWSDW